MAKAENKKQTAARRLQNVFATNDRHGHMLHHTVVDNLSSIMQPGATCILAETGPRLHREAHKEDQEHVTVVTLPDPCDATYLRHLSAARLTFVMGGKSSPDSHSMTTDD